MGDTFPSAKDEPMSQQADSAAQPCTVSNLTATSDEVPLDDEGARSDGEAGARMLARSSGGAGGMRLPDHRARRAWLLAEFGHGPGPEDDEATRKAVLYLHLRQSPKEGQPLPPSIQDTAAAFELHQVGGIPRWHLEARLLTGVPLAEVGRLCGLAEAVVQAYADVFFDVLTSLEAEDFIDLHAIGHDPKEPMNPDGPGAILKLAAYQGGPLVLEGVLQSLSHPPVEPEEYGRLNADGLQAVAADLRCRGWMLTHSLPLSFFATGQVKVLQASLERLRRCAEEMAGEQRTSPIIPSADVESVLDSIDLSPPEQRRRA
jgi:hypothetical protein